MRGTATHPFVSCLTDASDVKSLNGANQRIPECESVTVLALALPLGYSSGLAAHISHRTPL